MEAQTVFRCCPGWSQQPGDQGCLSRECPPPKPVPQKRLRLKGLSPAWAVQTLFLYLVALPTVRELPTLPPPRLLKRNSPGAVSPQADVGRGQGKRDGAVGGLNGGWGAVSQVLASGRGLRPALGPHGGVCGLRCRFRALSWSPSLARLPAIATPALGSLGPEFPGGPGAGHWRQTDSSSCPASRPWALGLSLPRCLVEACHCLPQRGGPDRCRGDGEPAGQRTRASL